MNHLLFCLNATVPIFSLMLLGIFFRKINLFDEGFINKANKFVFTVAIPVLLFKDMSTADISTTWNTAFVLFCLISTLLSVVIAYFLSVPFRNSCSQGEFIQSSYRSSVAILGIALTENIYGHAGMAPLMLIGAVPVYNIIAVLVLELFKPNDQSFDAQRIKKTTKEILTNPIILGVIVGILWSTLKIPVPDMLSKTINSVSNLATPLGLMTMGAAFNMNQSLGNLKPALVVTFMKLIGYAAIFLPFAVFLGFRDSHLVSILIMLSSPATVAGYIMAKNMGHEGTLSSTSVMLTTALSAFTLTLWLFILRSLGLI